MTEKNVRSVFENDPNVTLKEGVELVNISEDPESVTITYRDESEKEHLSRVFPIYPPC
jgi:2-polyprenyl-6-methoxyphenol hydroxylase-like FAD-dependent oxidoreductase